MILFVSMLDKSIFYWGNSWRTYPYNLYSSIWGIVISKLCWDKTSRHLLLLRILQLSSIQTKSEISKYKEFRRYELTYYTYMYIYIYLTMYILGVSLFM